MLLTLWIIPLFPAEPKLGPILNHITHYQGFRFPLLLIVLAAFIDTILSRYPLSNDWKSAVLLGAVFLVVLFAVQWYFGAFLLESEHARNWFFGSHYMSYGRDPEWEYRYRFASESIQTGIELIKGLSIALGCSIISSRIGLLWGNWMNKVKR